MVFNVMTNNTDDHSKNFSFVLEDNCWRLAPAYDVTFIFNVNGTRSEYRTKTKHRWKNLGNNKV